MFESIMDKQYNVEKLFVFRLLDLNVYLKFGKRHNINQFWELTHGHWVYVLIVLLSLIWFSIVKQYTWSKA